MCKIRVSKKRGKIIDVASRASNKTRSFVHTWNICSRRLVCADEIEQQSVTITTKHSLINNYDIYGLIRATKCLYSRKPRHAEAGARASDRSPHNTCLPLYLFRFGCCVFFLCIFLLCLFSFSFPFHVPHNTHKRVKWRRSDDHQRNDVKKQNKYTRKNDAEHLRIVFVFLWLFASTFYGINDQR